MMHHSNFHPIFSWHFAASDEIAFFELLRYSLFYIRAAAAVCVSLCTTFVYLTCNRLSPTDIVCVCVVLWWMWPYFYILYSPCKCQANIPAARALITAYRYKREKIAACLMVRPAWCSSFILLWGDYLLLNADYNRIHTCSSSVLFKKSHCFTAPMTACLPLMICQEHPRWIWNLHVESERPAPTEKAVQTYSHIIC